MASARYPSSRNASRATLSRRLDSFCRFSLTTTGTWAQTGGVGEAPGGGAPLARVVGLEVRPLVAPPAEAQPVERGQHPLGPPRLVAGRVGVLDAQPKHPALLAGKDPFNQTPSSITSTPSP